MRTLCLQWPILTLCLLVLGCSAASGKAYQHADTSAPSADAAQHQPNTSAASGNGHDNGNGNGHDNGNGNGHDNGNGNGNGHDNGNGNGNGHDNGANAATGQYAPNAATGQYAQYASAAATVAPGDASPPAGATPTVAPGAAPPAEAAEEPQQSAVQQDQDREPAAPPAEAAEEPQQSAVQQVRQPDIPAFPWPPPLATTARDIPDEYLVEPGREISHLSDIDSRISEALYERRYDRAYFSVPDGFAVVTRLEQFRQDGTSEVGPNRWATEKGPMQLSFSLEYLRAILEPNPGYYRVIVFVVTPHFFVYGDDTVTRGEAMAWLDVGANKLPDQIGQREYTENYTTTALVYEYEQPRRGAKPIFRKLPLLEGGATEHLVKAKIWTGLEV